MKQGVNTGIGLLTFMLLATFAAAGYFVSRAYDAQSAQALAVQLVGKQKKRMTALEQIVKRLESEWQVAATESDNAKAQLDQLQGLIENQDQEIKYLQKNLDTAGKQLDDAISVRVNLSRQIVQLNKEKEAATGMVAGLSDQLIALEKEFNDLKIRRPPIAVADPKPVTIEGVTLEEVKVRLKELESIKAKERQPPAANLSNPQPAVVADISGAVRKVDAKFGFVILDVGAPDGVKLGDLFSVSRANEAVGQLRVRKMLSGLPVCDVVAENTIGTILAGDRVRLLR